VSSRVSKQAQLYDDAAILYRWMRPTVNPYSCGDDRRFHVRFHGKSRRQNLLMPVAGAMQ